MRVRSLSIAFGVLLSMSASAWWGCSASETRASGSSGGANGGGGGGSTAAGLGGIDTDAGTSDAEEACLAWDVEAGSVPLDMIVLLDRSASMAGQKWDGSTDALKGFVEAPASAGIRVGIEYFPVEAPSDGEDCNPLHYETLDVDVDVLPANAPTLVASIDAQEPSGVDTPTYAALKGALLVSTDLQHANPDHKVILVFASDGDPNGCPSFQNDIPVLAGLAKSSYAADGVQTYVIAINGSTVANLDQIAAAGGTVAAFDVTNDIAQFSQKMAEIRAAALACDFTIPEAPPGETLDPALVNVGYTPGGMGEPTKIPKADNLGDCGQGPGWYYDNEAQPTKILLCPASCETVQADAKAYIRIALGCASLLN